MEVGQQLPVQCTDAILLQLTETHQHECVIPMRQKVSKGVDSMWHEFGLQQLLWSCIIGLMRRSDSRNLELGTFWSPSINGQVGTWVQFDIRQRKFQEREKTPSPSELLETKAPGLFSWWVVLDAIF
ncbi:unnamed protein product [Calypogeia fissa]